MTAHDDITKQHYVNEVDENEDVDVNNGDPITPESIDDDQTEVSTNQVDDLPSLKKEIDEEEEREEGRTS